MAIAGRVLRSEQFSEHGKQAEWIQAEVAVARNASAAAQMRHVKQEEGAHGNFLENAQHGYANMDGNRYRNQAAFA
jgi:hypothetical protein